MPAHFPAMPWSPLAMPAHLPGMPCAPPCHAVRTPLSCCAQSQHPERPVEHSKSEVPGFRDYARNDEVEDPTLCDEYRDVTLRAHPWPCPHIPCHARAHPCHAARPPCHAARTPLSCCAQSQHPEMPVERSELGVPGFRDYARNDEVEGPTLSAKVENPTLCGEYRDVTLRRPCPARGPFPEWPPIARGDRPGSATPWLWTVNSERPNMAIGGVSPVKKGCSCDRLLCLT